MANPFAKMLAKNELLVPHLDNWFAQYELLPETLKFEIHPHKEDDDAFHPSSADACARYLYAKRSGHLPERGKSLDVQRNKTFLFGHFFHAMIQHVVVYELKFGPPEIIEKEYRWGGKTKKGNEFWSRGFTDLARVEIPGQPEPILVDIKTMQSNQFALNQVPYATWDKWHAQVQLYLDWEDLDTGIILAAEKDNPHRFKEHRITRDPLFVNNIYDQWEYVADCLADMVVPDCTCDDPGRCPVSELYR
jgi:hypothetical protein